MMEELRRELAAAARSVYWSETEGRLAVTAWIESGESATEFGEKHGLSARRLQWWKRRLGAVTTTASPRWTNTVELVPIRVIPGDDRDERIEIVVGMFRIRIPNGVNQDALRTVVEVLRAC
jgi:hypothetical protein